MDLLRALAEHGHASVRLAGGSMAPTVAQGESVLVRRARPALGDVVVIQARDGLLVHRLVARLPGGRWVHLGDAAGALPGVCRDQEVVATAELPRRAPRRLSRLRYALFAVARALFVASLFVAALAGCKPKPPPAPPRPEVVEVRVVDRTPKELPAPDIDALTRAAAKVIGASGMPVVDGGAGAPFKLRVEVRLDGAEVPGKGVMRAFVVARLLPVGAAPGALSFEQAAVAEREYEQLPDRAAAFRAHAQRAVEDVVRGVGERARLARGGSDELLKALNGSDEDLREEAVRIAAERRDPAAVPPLVQMLKSDDRPTRDRAIGALAAIGDARAVKPLTEIAHFRETAELPKVLDALGAIGGDEARAYLEFVSSGHEDPEMRELAKEALRHLDARSTDKPRSH
jgi:HEAT repeats